MNLSEAFNAFALALEADQRTDSTVRWYASMLKDYLAAYGKSQVTDITVEDNRRFIVEYRRRDTRYVGAPQQPVKSGGPSDASVSAMVRALNGFWNWCEREELISRTPMKGIRNNTPRKRAPRAASESDITRIFETCEDDPEGYRDRAIMAVMADTGVRVGGLCSIRLKTLNLERGTLVVHEKRGTVRQVPFSSFTALFIFQWLEKRPAVPHDFVFTGKKLNPLTTFGVYQMLRRRAEAAGVTGDVHPHAWREFFARGYLERGGDVATLSRLLGNSPEVILKSYTLHTSAEVMESHDKYSPFKGMLDGKS
jgi:site-specific recombinase XerD